MKNHIIIFAISPVFIFLTNNILACSGFCLNDSNRIVFGFNFDSNGEIGYVMINKHQVFKTANTVFYEDTPAQWISKYGSITFNGFGKEHPYSGINEKGLTMAMMWLKDTEYPIVDHRPSLNCLQWMQYQLDNSESVDDVLSSQSKIRIAKHSPGSVHYLIIDRFGKIAAIEFLKGEMIYHTGDELPVPLLCNDKYDKSIKSLIEFMDFGSGDNNITKAGELVKGRYDDDRFIKGTYKIKQFITSPSKHIIDDAFGILDYIKQSCTLWTIVYDINNSEIYYKTKNNQTLRKININDFNYDCGSDDIIIDVDKSFDNPQNAVEEFTTEKNKKIILNNKNGYPFENAPVNIWDEWAEYPEKNKCVK